MKLYWSELTDQEKGLSFDEKEEWVRDAVLSVDETPLDTDRSRLAPPGIRRPDVRPIHFELNHRKLDDVAVITGKINSSVLLHCSRCAARFPFPCHLSFHCLYSRNPQMAGIPDGRSVGEARHHHQDDTDQSAHDYEITHITDDAIDLDALLREQLQLQIPVQPLCRENCQGICPQCGADWNEGHCACEKIVKSSPFSVLKDIHVSRSK